jgi:hypothetical protein
MTALKSGGVASVTKTSFKMAWAMKDFALAPKMPHAQEF